VPAKLIILRHGEKPKGRNSSLQLSRLGKARAQALKDFLGEGGAKSLLGKHGPDAFYAITPHTVETAMPSAESWNMPVTVYGTSAKASDRDTALDVRTQEAARDVMTSKAKTIVMVWEHHHIASTTLDPNVTLRRLLNLEKVAPEEWPDDDFDSVWIARFSKHGKVKDFEIVPQHFHAKPAKRKAKGRKAKRKERGT